MNSGLMTDVSLMTVMTVSCATQSWANAKTRAALENGSRVLRSPMFQTSTEVAYANYASLRPGLAVRRLHPQLTKADAHKPRASEVNKGDTGHRQDHLLQPSCKTDR